MLDILDKDLTITTLGLAMIAFFVVIIGVVIISLVLSCLAAAICLKCRYFLKSRPHKLNISTDSTIQVLKKIKAAVMQKVRINADSTILLLKKIKTAVVQMFHTGTDSSILLLKGIKTAVVQKVQLPWTNVMYLAAAKAFVISNVRQYVTTILSAPGRLYRHEFVSSSNVYDAIIMMALIMQTIGDKKSDVFIFIADIGQKFQALSAIGPDWEKMSELFRRPSYAMPDGDQLPKMVKIPTTNLSACLDASALSQAYGMLYDSFANFRKLTARRRNEVVALIARDIINFEDRSGHSYAPRRAFHIAAQSVQLQFAEDWFEYYPKMKVRPQLVATPAPATKVFALFVFMVYANVCAFESIEASDGELLTGLGGTKKDKSNVVVVSHVEHSEGAQPETPLRRVASHDSGYCSANPARITDAEEVKSKGLAYAAEKEDTAKE